MSATIVVFGYFYGRNYDLIAFIIKLTKSRFILHHCAFFTSSSMATNA